MDGCLEFRRVLFRSLPYSPEFAPEQPGRGPAALEQIATTSGGKERIEIPQTWAELQVKARYIEIVPWLLIASVLLFLVEIFERRTGWISRTLTRQKPAAVVEVEAAVQTAPRRKTESPLKRIIRERKQKVATAPAAATTPAQAASN